MHARIPSSPAPANPRRRNQRRSPARPAAHASASSSRSLPQKSSSPTTAVGAPKMPRAIARSVSTRRRAFASGAPAVEPELEHRSAHATHEGTSALPTQRLFSARRRCDDPAAMAQRGLAALVLGLVLAAPAWPDAASVAAHLEGEKAECDLLLGLCRAANRAARFAQETP